jgi:sugar (glycoside-pentoside-hexuronide) transporter
MSAADQSQPSSAVATLNGRNALPLAGGRLSVGEKLGYSVGDAAANFVFQSLIVFQTIFYTDTFGLSAAETALLLLVARVSDAFFDPLFGILSDRTTSRWGKFRPWIIATAIPYGVMAVIAFSTPDFGHFGKLVYAYATYLGLMLVYSANNLPYSALSGVMTGDLVERTSLSQYRFFLAISASFVIQAVTPHMLTRFSGGSTHWTPHAFRTVMTIFGALSVVFFVVTFFSTRERIVPAADQRKASIGEDLAGLVKNGPWVALFALTLLVFITLSMRGGSMAYYFQYYLKSHVLGGRDLDKVPLFGIFDGFGFFNAVSQGASLLGILFSKPLAVRFGKREVFIAGLAITAVLTAAFAFFDPSQLTLMYVTEGIRSLAYGFTIPLLWAMMADVADYSEWTTGRRATGIVFSAIVFGLKAGLGFGGAIMGWLLDAYGYVSPIAGVPQTQSAHALDGIRLTSSLYASLPFFAGVVCLFFYKINKQMAVKITDELAERRRKAAVPSNVGLPSEVIAPEAP